MATKNKHSRRLAVLAVAGLALAARQAFASPILSGFDSNSLPRIEDTSTKSAVPVGFTMHFFNQNTDRLFVNENGNVTFGIGLSAYTPFDLKDTTVPIFAPFFADVTTSGVGNPVTYGPGTVAGHSAFGVNWRQVTGEGLGSSLVDSFQLLLVDRADTGAGNFDMYFNYGHIAWDTGTFSGVSAVAGYGTQIAGPYYTITGSAILHAFLDNGPDPLFNTTNDGVPGQYQFLFRSGDMLLPASDPRATDVPAPGTVALIAQGLLCLLALRRRMTPGPRPSFPNVKNY